MSWRTATLIDLVTLQRGFDITKAAQRPGDVPVVSSSGIGSYHDEAKAPGPGVVIGRKGTLGTVFFIDKPFWPHDTTLWVTDFHGNEPRYAYYFLKTLRLAEFDVGAANPTLNRNHIHGLPIRLPDRAAQGRIADVLSVYDDLIENNTRRIKILEEMARSLYREWFVNFRFPGHEKLRQVATQAGPVPQGWPVRPLTEVIELNPRTTVAKEAEKPFVPMTSLSNDSMLITGVERREGNSGAKFKNGDTLFARITPCLENGKTGYVQFLSDEDAVAFGSTEFIVMRERELTREMIYLLARSEALRDHAIKSMSGATGRQRVQERCFDTFFVAVPPPSLRDRFSACVRPIFEAVYALARKNVHLRAARDLLLPRLVSGEIELGP